MRTYTTCGSCGRELLVSRYRQDTHEHCPPVADYIHQQEAAMLAATMAGQNTAADRYAQAIDAYDNRPPRMLEAALAYAQWGWPVFPCRPGHKVPLIARERGGRGLHDATTEADQITAWWKRSPLANIAVATGHRFDVIDVDPAGHLAWADLRAHRLWHDSDPDTPLDIHGGVSTPRGGAHIYLPPTGGGNLAGFLPGIDYRGLGGYVLVPPSVLDVAALRPPVPSWPLRYRWAVAPSPTLTHQAGWTR